MWSASVIAVSIAEGEPIAVSTYGASVIAKGASTGVTCCSCSASIAVTTASVIPVACNGVAYRA